MCSGWNLAECGVTANGMDSKIILAIHMVVVCIEILSVRQRTFVIFFGDTDEVELGVFSNEALVALPLLSGLKGIFLQSL